jgi:hypothetical protein
MTIEAQSILNETTTSTPLTQTEPSGVGVSLAPKPVSAPTIPDDPTQIGDDASYQVKGAEFRKLFERRTKAELRKQFGTDDLDAIKARLQEHEQLKAQQDEMRRAQMSEAEQMKEDLAKERAARERAELKARQLQDRQQIARETLRVRALASKHVDPKMVRYAELELASFLRKKFTPKEMNKLKDTDLDKFFKAFVQKNPKFAKQEARPLPRVGVTNGVNPPPRGQNVQQARPLQKTAKPGQPNTMSKAELRALGYDY